MHVCVSVSAWYVCVCVCVLCAFHAEHSHLQTAWEWTQHSRHRAESWTTAVSASQSGPITRCPLPFESLPGLPVATEHSHVYFMSLLCTWVCEGAWGLALSPWLSCDSRVCLRDFSPEPVALRAELGLWLELLVVELEDDEDKGGEGVKGTEKLVQDFRFESCWEVYVLEKPIWRLETPSVVPWLQGETKQGEIEQ